MVLPTSKRRILKQQKTNAELLQLFWEAPSEAYFNQVTIAPVIGCTTKTLESNRWRGVGVPFRKVVGRVLYKKKDVLDWLESHSLVTSTSQYKVEVKNDGLLL